MAATNPEIVGKFLSTLPEDDDHPYRTGPWRPQTTEWDADDLTAVEGEIPTYLDGVYLRNTENPLHPALKFYHPFDGDGMSAWKPGRWMSACSSLGSQNSGKSLRIT